MPTDVITLLADVIDRKLDNPAASTTSYIWERIANSNTNMPSMAVDACRLADALAAFMALHYAATVPEDGKALARQILANVRFVAVVSDFDESSDE